MSTTVEAYVGAEQSVAPDGSATTLTLTGALTIQATSASNPTETCDVGSGGIFNGTGETSNATADSKTRAYLGGGLSLNHGVVVTAGSLTVTAIDADVVQGSATIGSGGVINVSDDEADVYVTPTIDAHIGTNVSANITGGVDVEATSARAEGDATAGEYAGGGVNVGFAVAKEISAPIVNGFIDSGSSITAGGDVTVMGSARSDPAKPLNGIMAVNTGTSIITSPENLADGTDGIYDYGASKAPIQSNGAPLQNDRVFRILALGGNTYQLGDSFDASQAGANSGNLISFSSPDDFQTGDEVQYDNNGNATSVGNLAQGGTYFVRVLTPTTIQLYSSLSSAKAAADFFTPSSAITVVKDSHGVVTNTYFNTNPAGFAKNEAVTYEASPGEPAVGGLISGHTYFVTNLNNGDGNNTAGTFQLKDTSGNIVTLDPTTTSGSFHQLVPNGIALSPGSGAQKLFIAFSGASTNTPTGDALLLPGSGPFASPPAGNGQSRSTAEGGNGGIVAVSKPTASTSYNPTVQAYVAANLVSAGGNVKIASESIGNTTSHGDNAGGGLGYGGFAAETTNFTSSSQAFVGSPGSMGASGVTINALGAFSLLADTQLTTSPSGHSDGGGLVAVTEDDGTANATAATNAIVGSSAHVSATSVNVMATGSSFNVSISPSSTSGGLFGAATADAECDLTSTALAQIKADATVTGAQGVDVRTQNENFNPSLTADGTFYGLGPSNSDNNNHNHMHSNVEADAGATVIAGPRPAGTPLVPTFTGFPFLALYVQTQDANLSAANEDRTTVWNANVTINSGIAPLLVIQPDPAHPQFGKIITDDNVMVSDGSLNPSETNPVLTVGQDITSGTAGVHDITSPHIGQAYFTGDDSVSNSDMDPPYPATYSRPLFTFDYAFGSVTILNSSDQTLEIHKIDVADAQVVIQAASGEQDVHAQAPGVDVTNIGFKFRIAETVLPSLVEIENQNPGVAASDIDLTDVIQNPIGKTIITNVRGNIYATQPAQAIWTNNLDLQASQNIGTGANRIVIDLIESEDPNNNDALRPIVFAATATDGNVYLDLTARRRDDPTSVPLSTPFTVPMSSISAGGDIDVVLEESEQDPGITGNAFGLTVGVDSSSGIYKSFFHPLPADGSASGLDFGVFVNLANSAAIPTTTYDFQPSTGQVDGSGAANGLVGLTAGGNIIVNAAHATAVDPTINIVGTINLTGSGHLDTTTNGSINYGEGSQGGTMRVHVVQSNAASVMLTVPYVFLVAGQELDLVAANMIDGLISAFTTVLLQVGDNMTTAGDSVPTNPAATMITAGVSITIDGDYGNSTNPAGSTITINGALSSPLTNINAGGANNAVNLSTSHDINSQITSVISSFTGAVVNVDGQTGVNALKVSDATYQGQDNGVLTDSALTGLGMGGNGLTYTNIQNLEVDLSQGNVSQGDTFTGGRNYFAVLSIHTNTPTLVQGGAGNDTVVVASDAIIPADGPLFTNGTLAGILGALTVDGEGGTANRLIVSNYAATTSQTVKVTSKTIENFAPVLLTYQATGGNFTDAGAHDGIRIVGANVGGNTFNVQSTLAGSTTHIDGDGGANDFFNVWSDASGTGVGTPTATGNVQTIAGDLEVVGGTGAANRLIASDFGHARPDTDVTVTNSEITGLAPANLFYSASGNFTDPATARTFDGILLLGPRGGGNTFNVQSTLSGSTTQILGEGGNADYFNVYSDAIGSGPGASDRASNVLGIQGKLTVIGGSSLFNRLIVSDKGDDGTHSSNLNLGQIVVTDHSILNFAPAFIYYSTDPGNYTDAIGPNNGLWIQGSLTAPNSFLVYSTLLGNTMEIDGGAKNDNFNFAAELVNDIVNPDTADPALPATFFHDQGDLNYLKGLATLVGNGGADSLEANDHGKLYTIGGVQQYATDDNGNPILPFDPLHINDDGLPATGAPAAGLAGNPHFQYKVNDSAYGYNYLVTPNVVMNDPATILTIPTPTTPPPRTFAGIVYNMTGKPGLDTITFTRLDGTDRINKFTVVPDIKNVTTFMIDGNMPDTACRKDGGDYLDLNTTLMGAPGSAAVFSRTLHIFTVPFSFTGTTDGTNYCPDLPAAGAGDTSTPPTTVPPLIPGTPLSTYQPATPGVDSGELSSATGNGFWSFIRGGKTYAKPVYFLSIEHFNHVAIVAQVSVPLPNSNQAPQVIVKDAETGDVKFTVQPYESYFHGGITVAVGDLNCDGIPDLAVIPQQGHTALVKIYDGSPDAFGNYPHKLLNSFLAFNATFLGGGSIAIGDVNYDGHNDLIIGAGQGYVPVIEVYNGKNVLNPAPPLLGQPFFAFNSAFRETINQNFKGGVNVAVGDLNNDGYADIVATIASNGPPIVNVFNGNGYGFVRGFYAFNSANFPGSLSLAVGDVTGDGIRDIIVGASPGYVPVVTVFNGATLFTAPTITPVKTVTVAPTYFHGAIVVQAAPNDGGNPGTVELDAIFATLMPDETHGSVANELFVSITSFNTGGRGGSNRLSS